VNELRKTIKNMKEEVNKRDYEEEPIINLRTHSLINQNKISVESLISRID
jgi:hypothetical protein